jgi:hypothetical protein
LTPHTLDRSRDKRGRTDRGSCHGQWLQHDAGWEHEHVGLSTAASSLTRERSVCVTRTVPRAAKLFRRRASSCECAAHASALLCIPLASWLSRLWCSSINCVAAQCMHALTRQPPSRSTHAHTLCYFFFVFLVHCSFAARDTRSLVLLSHNSTAHTLCPGRAFRHAP